MLPRFIESRLREHRFDIRVESLTGPRQAGKTTLAKKVAASGSPFLTLDDPTVRAAAKQELCSPR